MNVPLESTHWFFNECRVLFPCDVNKRATHLLKSKGIEYNHVDWYSTFIETSRD